MNVSTASQLLSNLQLDDFVYGVAEREHEHEVEAEKEDGVQLWNIPGLGVVGVGAATAMIVGIYAAHPEMKEAFHALTDVLGNDDGYDEKLDKTAETIGQKGLETQVDAPVKDGDPRIAAEPIAVAGPKAEAKVPDTPEPVVSRGGQVPGSGMPLSGPLARPTYAVDQVLQNTAKKEGVDYRTLYALAGSESSFSTGANAKNSSATGLFQFTASTWQYLTQKVYPELRYKASDRTDPQKSAVVAARYIKSIKASLAKKLGRDPSIGEAYLGYFMGPTGAASFLDALKKNPNAKGADVFPQAASANPYLFYHQGDKKKPLTLQETMGRLEGKVTAYYEQASTMPVVAQTETSPPLAASGPQAVPVSANLPAQAAPQPVPVPAPDFTAVKGGAKGETRDQQVAGRQGGGQQGGPAPIMTSGPGKKEQAGEVAYVRDKQGRLVSIRS